MFIDFEINASNNCEFVTYLCKNNFLLILVNLYGRHGHFGSSWFLVLFYKLNCDYFKFIFTKLRICYPTSILGCLRVEVNHQIFYVHSWTSDRSNSETQIQQYPSSFLTTKTSIWGPGTSYLLQGEPSISNCELHLIGVLSSSTLLSANTINPWTLNFHPHGSKTPQLSLLKLAP